MYILIFIKYYNITLSQYQFYIKLKLILIIYNNINISMSTYNKINLQLGDIIQINAPTNSDLHNYIFYIKYIDNEQLDIINPDKLYSINIKDNNIDDESIENIYLLHRHESPSYAIQNNLITGKSISIFFAGKLPTIINGKITNLEEDMIEIITYPSKDTIYIDFAFSGIPKNLNIDKIIEIDDIKESFIDEDSENVINQQDEYGKFSKQYDVEQNMVISIEDDNDEFQAYQEEFIDFDSIKIGEDLEDFQHTVNVDEDEIRYTLEQQIEDYIDKHLNNIPPQDVTNKTLENINLEILRYVELREMYSYFDKDENPNILPPIDDGYKPLVNNYLKNLDKQVDWLIPVTYNIRELMLDNDIKDEIYNDDQYLQIIKYNDFTKSLSDIINEWKSKSSKPCEYKYYINKLLSLFSNSLTNENTDNIKNVNNVTNTIVNNYEDLTSYSVSQINQIKKSNFITERLNVGLTTEEQDIQNKKLKNTVTLTNNDNIVVSGLLMLNFTYYNYSIKSGNYSNILDCANVSKCKTVFNTILNTDTILNEHRYTELENSQMIKPDDFIKDINILNNFNIYYYDKQVSQNNNSDNYLDLLELAIPDNNSVINNLHEYYDYYNIDSFIKFHQGFNIDMYNINYKSYMLVQKYIKANIENYDTKYRINQDKIENLINKLQTEVISEYKIDIQKYVKNILNFIDKPLHTDIYTNYNISPDIGLSTSEIISTIYNIDGGTFLNSVLNKNILNLLITNLLDTYIKNKQKQEQEQEQQQEEQEQEQEQQQEKPINESDKILNENCIKYIISKRYKDLDLLLQDNDKLIFFDDEFDTTNYTLVNDYTYERQLLDDYKFVNFLQQELIGTYSIDKSLALREAKAIVDKKREIIDGDYAILENKTDNRNYIYVRKDNKWIIDEKFIDNFYIDGNQLFCNINKDCVHSDKKCNTIDKDNKDDNVEVKNILRNFTLEYNVSIEEIKQKINKQYEIANNRIKQIVNRIKHIDETKDLIMNSNIQHSNIIVSPYEHLKNLILGETNIINKYSNIKQFCILFTREAININDESQYWLYCKKTNTKLMPIFLLKLANVFIEKGNYIEELDYICANQGTISSDNNNWIDKHSGYIIKPIEYNNEEGYEDGGHKLKTRDVLEAEYSINNPKQKKYLSKDNQHIVNIVNAIAKYTSINLDSNIEFIINGVNNLQKTLVLSEKSYNDAILKAKQKDPKAKPLPNYNDMYNSSLLIITLSYILIVIQTNIPSITSKKTFPGCIKSFKGYPIDGDQDKSGLIYIMCVANKIKSSIEPWNSILKFSESMLCKKCETIIDKYIIKIKDVKDLIVKKLEYQQLHENKNIDSEVSIKSWYNFKPSLIVYKLESSNIQSIPEHFHDIMIENIKTGKQNMYREELISKILYFTNAIILSIENTVTKSSLLLKNNSDEAFLENSCCHGINNAIDYFIDKDKSIEKYINSIVSLHTILERIDIIKSASILYDPTNNMLKILNFDTGYSEDIIYGSFIHYCNFGINIPISNELESLCLGKPLDFDKSKSLKDNIEKLKSSGKVYTHDMLIELIQYVSNKNIIKNIFSNIPINNTQNIKTIIDHEIYKNSNSEYELLFNEKFYILFNQLLDNYSIKKSTSDDLRQFKNFLGSQNNILNKNIIEYIKKYTNKSKREYDKIIEYLNTKLSSNDNLFIKNTFLKMINIFPNYLLNNSRKLGKVPKHWNLSDRHNDDIYNIIENYYKLFNSFKNKDYLKTVFNILNDSTNIIINLFQYIKYVKSIYLDRDKKEEIQSIYDQDFIVMLYQYFLYSVLYQLIDLKNNKMFILNIINSHDYDNDEYDKIICEILEIYIISIFKQYNLINVDYNKINEKINIAKENEKTNITDFLKSLSDEEREIQNIFKTNKLEKWSAGLQKGMTQYVKSTYDNEISELEKQAAIDKKLNKKNQVTDMNRDIYKMDIEEEENVSNDIEKEEYDMKNIPDDDDDDDEYDGDKNSDVESDTSSIEDLESDVEFD